VGQNCCEVVEFLTSGCCQIVVVTSTSVKVGECRRM